MKLWKKSKFICKILRNSFKGVKFNEFDKWNFLKLVTNISLREGVEVNRKEIKKIDEKGQEKISGGAKVAPNQVKKIPQGIMLPSNYVLAVAYGAVTPFLSLQDRILLDSKKLANDYAKKKLTNSQPKSEEKADFEKKGES